MFRAASSVLAGSGPPGGLAAENSALHAREPDEFTQAAKIFASELIFATGIEAPVGGAAPGAAPVERSTRLLTFANAFNSPCALAALVPTCASRPMNGASAQTEATVVTSLITIDGMELRASQGPRAAINAIAGLSDPVPGLPPVATR